MSTEFQREERYVVFKLSDVEEHFTPGEKQHLERLVEVQRAGREEAGKPPLECVVVESDWPEYEPTWKAIEARVTGAQPAPSVPNLDMDALERQNDWLREEVCRLREGLALIADQYEPKCSLLIPSIARTALNATGAYGQKESPESWPTEAMVTAFAELFNVRDQKNTFGPAFRAALAAAPEAKP